MIDKTLDDMRTKTKDETSLTKYVGSSISALILESHVAFSSAIKELYNKDKVLYGKPEDTERRVVDVAKVPDWQNVIDKYAKAVNSQGKKRKRTE